MISALRYLPILLQKHPCACDNEEIQDLSNYKEDIDKLVNAHNEANLTIIKEYLNLLYRYLAATS